MTSSVVPRLRLFPYTTLFRSQQQVKRALEVAAAGNHSVLMVGPPGTGKSMLAARFPGILPSLSENESLQVAAGSEEHTSELQSLTNLVCRLLLEKKNKAC